MKANRILLGTLGILLLGGGIVFVVKKSQTQEPLQTVRVSRGILKEDVRVTGKIVSAQKVDISAERSGKVKNLPAHEGDVVKAGQVIIELDPTEVASQLRKSTNQLESAKASVNQYASALDLARVRLEELKKGARPEEVKLIQTKVDNTGRAMTDAQDNLKAVESLNASNLSKVTNAYEDAKKKADNDLASLYGGVRDILNDAYAKASDAVNKQTDEMFTQDTTTNPRVTFSPDSQMQTDVESQRASAGRALDALRSDLLSLPSEQAQLDGTLERSKNNLSTIRTFLVLLADALNSASISQATITTYKGQVNTGLTNVNTALTTLTTKQQAITTQKQTNEQAIATAQHIVDVQKDSNKSALVTAQTRLNDSQNANRSAQDELALKKAPPTTEQVRSQQAQVNQASANLQAQTAVMHSAESQLSLDTAELEKMNIKSPIDGVVTKIVPKLGELVGLNVIVASVAQPHLEIEANIPEVDIPKISIGNLVDVTIDALPGEHFGAKVFSIEPAETIIDGVVHYKIKIAFATEDTRLKSGLTSNCVITTREKNDTLLAPQIAIIERDGKQFVKKVINGSAQEVAITTGMRGSDGSLEVLSGVSEGDMLVNVGLKSSGKK